MTKYPKRPSNRVPQGMVAVRQVFSKTQQAAFQKKKRAYAKANPGMTLVRKPKYVPFQYSWQNPQPVFVPTVAAPKPAYGLKDGTVFNASHAKYKMVRGGPFLLGTR